MTTPRTAASASHQGLATGQFLLICMQPFGAAVLVTVVLVLETWARPLPVLAPGAAWRLALPGALGALALWALVWWQLRRRALHPQWRKAGAALSLASSVLATPVLALGALQWVNARFMEGPQHTPMQLMALSTSPRKGHSEPYHWAQLQPLPGGTLAAGKYLIPEPAHAAWNTRRPATVTVHHARGLLGAQVVLDFSDGPPGR